MEYNVFKGCMQYAHLSVEKNNDNIFQKSVLKNFKFHIMPQ